MIIGIGECNPLLGSRPVVQPLYCPCLRIARNAVLARSILCREQAAMSEYFFLKFLSNIFIYLNTKSTLKLQNIPYYIVLMIVSETVYAELPKKEITSMGKLKRRIHVLNYHDRYFIVIQSGQVLVLLLFRNTKYIQIICKTINSIRALMDVLR